jgi:hypothetical protein
MLKALPRTLRVHSLTGRITLESLRKAFKAVKRNRGAAGLDKQSIKMFAANLEENLLALMRELKSGTYLMCQHFSGHRISLVFKACS